MKKTILFLFSCFIGALLLSSCNEEVDMIGDFQETAVVFGLLDRSENVHFIKITRAYIGPGNSLELAQIPDSSYFNQVDATITERINGTQTRVWTLQDTIVENKDTQGVFYAPTQKLYYFTTTSSAPLDKNGIYTLDISVNGGEFEVQASTEIVSGISTTADGQNFRFDFVKDPGEFQQKNISVDGGNSYVVNTSLEVFFHEFNTGVDTNLTSFKWTLGEYDVTPGKPQGFSIPGRTFYELMAANVTNDPLINKRQMYSVKIIVTGGAENLYNYMSVNQPSSSLAQNKPTFTNLTATNGHKAVGIFSSRNTYSIEKFFINTSNNTLRMMAQKSVAELCVGAITGNLFFCSQHVGDNGTAYDCQ